MFDTTGRSRGLLLAGITAASAAVASCDGNSMEPVESARFSQDVAFPEFRDALVAGAARVEIRVLPGTLTARRIEIERARELADREEVESRATGIEVAGNEGTVTLALGGLRVRFNRSTRFRDEGGNRLSFEQFVARVETSLAAGHRPGVEAKREPAATPQRPDDPTFVATRLELDSDPEDEIAINITDANLLANDAPPPDGWIRVLGIALEVRAQDGTTRLRARP
jgi:hypothetical protein